MIIGHLPAGYLLTRLLYPPTVFPWRIFILSGLCGALAPDLDMLYFHLIDHGQTHHHRYFTHFPAFWGGLLLLALFAWLLTRFARAGLLASVFAGNGMVHLCLDSIVGDIWWLAPFVDRPFSLFTVPALYQPWWLNFLLHWSFGLELGLVVWAVFVWQRGRDSR